MWLNRDIFVCRPSSLRWWWWLLSQTLLLSFETKQHRRQEAGLKWQNAAAKWSPHQHFINNHWTLGLRAPPTLQPQSAVQEPNLSDCSPLKQKTRGGAADFTCLDLIFHGVENKSPPSEAHQRDTAAYRMNAVVIELDDGSGSMSDHNRAWRELWGNIRMCGITEMTVIILLSQLVFSQNLAEKQRAKVLFSRRLEHEATLWEFYSVCLCVCVCMCASCLVFVFIFAALYNCVWGMETGCHGSGLNVNYSDVCVSVCVQRPEKDNVPFSSDSFKYGLWIGRADGL